MSADNAYKPRKKLMGEGYAYLLRAALAVRFSDDPVERLRAIMALREDVQEATPGDSTSITAALAKLRARAHT